MTDTPTDTNIYCDGCGCRLQEWDPLGTEEGDPMFIVPQAGGEKIYCETCFNKR